MSDSAMVERVFLGWNKPFLLSAAEYCLSRAEASWDVDLSSTLVVTPSGRAGRRLIEILVGLAEQSFKTLAPPRIVTLSGFADLICGEEAEKIGTLERRLAIVQACRSIDMTLLLELFPIFAQGTSLKNWILLAQEIESVFYEISASGKEIEEAARLAAELSDSDLEDLRWRALKDIYTAYELIIEQAKLIDPSVCLRKAVSVSKKRLAYTEILLLGCIDLSPAQQELLVHSGLPLKSLIFAPKEGRGRFDEFGSVDSQAWSSCVIPLSDDQVVIAAEPSAQAEYVRDALAKLGGRYSIGDISVGVVDQEVLPHLRQMAARNGLFLHEPAGASAAAGSVASLLRRIACFAESRRFSDLAALLRHPTLEHWITTADVPADYLIRLDRWEKEHLQDRLDEFRFDGVQLDLFVGELLMKIQKLLGPLLTEQRLVGEWSQEIRRLLIEIYCRGEGRSHGADQDSEIFALIGDVLARLESFQPGGREKLNGAAAIGLVLEDLQAKALTPPARDGAIEVLGWLELAWDDAPVLLVTGFNEGCIPQVINSHPFLPNSLRAGLGLTDNTTRCARDAYFLTAICHSREVLRVIAGTKNTAGDPLMPSKLVFMCEDHNLAGRALNFTGGAKSVVYTAASGSGANYPATFQLPRPVKLAEPIRVVGVTSLRDYIACPYRFYLRHILKLESMDDGAREMDALVFGTFAHAVLQKFAISPEAASSDAGIIELRLQQLLKEEAALVFGMGAYPAVTVQLHQLEERLKVFAVWQAGWAQQGWRILQSECSVADKRVVVETEGNRVALRGRIDRIDWNSSTEELAVLDYKTGERVESPDKVHRKKGAWVDLQLPAYEYALRKLGERRKIKLGYIALPGDLSAVRELWGDWSEAELEDAKACMLITIERIVREEFWPPSEDFRQRDDFASLFGSLQKGICEMGED